jgi:glycosyltransferase involved in cell wall biosynthesis
MPRVLHLIPSTDDAGAENQARYLIEHLNADGRYAPEVAYFRRGRAHARFEALGVPLRRLPARSPLLLDLPRRTVACRRAYGGDRPEIVQSWLFEGNLVAGCAFGGWPETRVVLTQRSGNSLRVSPWRVRATRWLRRRADHVIANSQEGVSFLVEAGFEPGRISITPHGVPEERVRPRRSRDEVRAQLGIAAGQEVVCAVGRADDTKDLPTLFAAMATVWRHRPDVTLLLVGPTEQEAGRIAGPLPERARALGWVEDPATLLAACDLLAISSWTEGHSNVADEALMLGLPVVTTDTGDHVDLVVRAGGRKAPIRSPEPLAAAILELLDDPPPRQRVQSEARRALSLERLVAETVGVYDRLLGR